MAVSKSALAAAKKYMRVDGDEDDELIKSLYSAAEGYLAGAGIARTEQTAAQYDLCLHSLTLHYYDHRDAVGNEASLPLGLRPILTQLKLTAITGED